MKAGRVALVVSAVGLGAGACTPRTPPSEGEVAKVETKAETEAPETKAEAEAPETKAETEAPEAVAPPNEPASPVAPPTPSLVGGPLPDVKAPAVVFAATANDRQWRIDMVDFSGMKVKKLERKLEALKEAEWAGEAEGGDEGDDEGDDEAADAPDPAHRAPKPKLFETKAGKALIPAGFAVGDPWTLVTAGGAEHHDAKGFDGVIMDGSGEMHFYVQLGEAPKDVERPAIAVRGHLPDTTRLAVPKAVAPSAVGPDVLAAVVSEISASLEPEMRDVLDKDPIEPSEVQLYPGRFPGKRTHVAFVDSGKDESEIPPVGSLLLVGEGGKVETLIAADPSVFGYVRLLGLLDVDGDGIDEVFFEDGYHEGWYVQMLQWSGEAPVVRQLTGDGI
jgi:hypothetical protein